jgi:hypothetical protein
MNEATARALIMDHFDASNVSAAGLRAALPIPP